MPEQKEGQVADEQKQTESSASGTSQTASQDGDLALDLAKKYVVNPRTGKTATGSQIRDMLGEVELKRKLESENSKLKESLEEMQGQFGTLQAQLNQLQIQKEVASALKVAKPKQAEADAWGEEQETSEIDPDVVFNRINEVSEKIVNDKLSRQNIDVSRLVAQELDKKEQEKQQAEYYKQVYEASKKATINTYRAKYPDIPLEDINEIAEKMDVMEGLREESSKNLVHGDRDKGADQWVTYNSLQVDVANRLAELELEQRRLARESERKKQLSDITMGAVRTMQEEPVFAQTLHPEKARLNIQEIRRKAKEMEAQLKRLQQP